MFVPVATRVKQRLRILSSFTIPPGKCADVIMPDATLAASYPAYKCI
ncbi:hypothetical protein AC26_2701 [Escherichia coli 1-176-05_S3_C2]|nr:hypothetical protein AC26_2701 [Escherichia coli 1-176-05_S3_C2]